LDLPCEAQLQTHIFIALRQFVHGSLERGSIGSNHDASHEVVTLIKERRIPAFKYEPAKVFALRWDSTTAVAVFFTKTQVRCQRSTCLVFSAARCSTRRCNPALSRTDDGTFFFYKQGHSIRPIARDIAHSGHTVRRSVREGSQIIELGCRFIARGMLGF
jgi:hypothetical protein